ncbi:MAG: PilW family protein [Cyanobacteriota bacterium]|jgi:hypothetical protein
MTRRFRTLQFISQATPSKKRLPSFTLVELLVGSVITVIVVSSLAALALISELRLGRDSEVNQNLRDQWGRALAFMNNEAQNAYWIRTSIAAWPCAGGALPPGPVLVLEGPPNPANNNQPFWNVVYGVRANGNSTQWRGFNRLVRCGPPFEALRRPDAPLPAAQQARRAAALAGNLAFTEQNTESVIADQLAQDNPLQIQLYDQTLAKDRDVQLSLFMSRRTGASYPPPGMFASAFHTQIRANRNPGFDVTGNPACLTTTDADGNQQPNSAACPSMPLKDSLGRTTYIKEFNLPSAGTFTVNGCNPNSGCLGPKSSSTIDVIFLKGNFADFTTRQFAAPGQANATGPCSRTSCWLSNGSQNVQIYDGNVLVFYDQILRL